MVGDGSASARGQGPRRVARMERCRAFHETPHVKSRLMPVSLSGTPEVDSLEDGAGGLKLIVALGFKMLADGPAAGQGDHALEPDPSARLTLDPVTRDARSVKAPADLGPVSLARRWFRHRCCWRCARTGLLAVGLTAASRPELEGGAGGSEGRSGDGSALTSGSGSGSEWVDGLGLDVEAGAGERPFLSMATYPDPWAYPYRDRPRPPTARQPGEGCRSSRMSVVLSDSDVASGSMPRRFMTVACAQRRPGPLTTAPPANDEAMRMTPKSALRMGAASLHPIASPQGRQRRLPREKCRGRAQGIAILDE